MDIRFIRVDLQRKVSELKFIELEIDNTTVATRKASLSSKCNAKELAAFRAIVGTLGFIIEWYPQLFARRKVVVHKVTPDSPKMLLLNVNEIISELKCYPHVSWTTRGINPMMAVEFTDASFQLSEAETLELKLSGKGLSEVEKSGRYPLLARMHCLMHRQGSLPLEHLEEPIMVMLDYEVVRLQRRVWSIHAAETISGRVTRLDNAQARRTWEWVSRTAVKSDLVTDSDSMGKSITANGTPIDTPAEAMNSLMELREQYGKGHFDLLHSADENNPVDILSKVGQDQAKLDRFRTWVQTCAWRMCATDKPTQRFVGPKAKADERGVVEILDEAKIMDDGWVSSVPMNTGDDSMNEWFVGSLADKESGFKLGNIRE